MRFGDHLRERLGAIERAGLLRTPRHVGSPQGPVARVDGRDVVLLCSNDYLGHAASPELAHAQREALAQWGTGAGASRLISGGMTPHHDAEAALADFVGAPSALLFSTGYAANVGAIQALVGPGDLVLSDALNHASLIDGCRLSRARVVVYPHGDVAEAARLLAEHRRDARAALIVTDGLFSMDGDVAPLAALRALADEHDAGLFVDDAHAIGVLGLQGRGAAAAAGIVPDVLVGTLGKAIGLAGAFVAGTPELTRLVGNRARSYVFSTAPPPALAATIPLALALAQRADDARARLLRHAAALRAGFTSLGLRTPPGIAPIVPVLLGDARAAMHASARLFELGVFAHGIRPPTVAPGTARLRVVPTAAHTDAHIESALEAFAVLARELRG